MICKLNDAPQRDVDVALKDLAEFLAKMIRKLNDPGDATTEADPVAVFHAACAKLNDAPQRDVDEVCDDMAEFLANMKPKWHVLKDDDQLVEAALETGLVRDLGG